ncbi:SH3 domain-containing YSC84-like protein 1 [Rhizoclosmatium hyalinum]|nr:SH3 domain-containing YSC84-like protein 1 [Rhizoclosmatium hyalinum]
MIEDFKSDCQRAADVLSSGIKDIHIPSEVLREAKGVAVLHVHKMAILGSSRSGHGVVVARLPSGEWSAPSAIEMTGKGFGDEFGYEISDIVYILRNDQAVEAFKKGHNITGGVDLSCKPTLTQDLPYPNTPSNSNQTVAVGPIGRTAQLTATLRSPTAIFTYSQSKGAFVGASVDFTEINQRSVTNAAVYGIGTRGEQILEGQVDMPEYDQVKALHAVLRHAQEE